MKTKAEILYNHINRIPPMPEELITEAESQGMTRNEIPLMIFVAGMVDQNVTFGALNFLRAVRDLLTPDYCVELFSRHSKQINDGHDVDIRGFDLLKDYITEHCPDDHKFTAASQAVFFVCAARHIICDRDYTPQMFNQHLSLMPILGWPEGLFYEHLHEDVIAKLESNTTRHNPFEAILKMIDELGK